MWKKPCCLPWWSKVGMALLTSGEKVRKRDVRDLFGFVDRVAWQSIVIRQDLEARDVEVRPCGVLAEARQPVTESTASR